MRTWTVYGLFDPRDHLPRYVGSTVMTLPNRLSQHRGADGARRIHLWFALLRREGVEPLISPIYVVGDMRTARVLEASTIRRFLDEGMPLFNARTGLLTGRGWGCQEPSGPRVLSRAHRRLRAACTDDVRIFAERLSAAGMLHEGGRRPGTWGYSEKRVHDRASSIWHGSYPELNEIESYERLFGVSLDDWLV